MELMNEELGWNLLIYSVGYAESDHRMIKIIGKGLLGKKCFLKKNTILTGSAIPMPVGKRSDCC